MATKSSSKESSSNVKSLSNKLASVSKQAKSLGINTSKADAMVAQTKAQGSKSFAGSSFEQDYQAGKYGAIPMNAMQNTPVANIPPKPQVADTGITQLLGMNVQNNQYVDPQKSEAENAIAQKTASNMSAFDIVQKFIGVPESKEPILAQAEKDAKLRQKEQAVNNYQSELNGIVAKQQQDLLQLRGTGSQQGVTEAVYGGQQAQINREAAIAALPVQAQLSAAQGNLELAQKQVERLFALKSEDIDRQYKYRVDMGNAVLGIANEAQKDILNVKLAEIQDKKDAEKQKLEFERQIYLKNLNDGGGGNGLTPAQINSTVNSIAGAYDNEPTVKEYNTIKRNVDIYNGLGTSATDDIQRVYTFAKVADPNSAVKEGEYDSIEKYSQALLGRAGLKVSRVFTPTGILTPEARTAMGKTLQTSLTAAEVGKNQVQAEYQRQIDDAYAGKNRTITEYTPPQPMGPVQPANNDEVAYDEIVNNKQGYFSRLWGALLGN